jgi:hypothetical protein
MVGCMSRGVASLFCLRVERVLVLFRGLSKALLELRVGVCYHPPQDFQLGFRLSFAFRGRLAKGCTHNLVLDWRLHSWQGMGVSDSFFIQLEQRGYIFYRNISNITHPSLASWANTEACPSPAHTTS